MPQRDRLHVLGEMLGSALLPSFHDGDVDRADDVVKAAEAAGAHAVEYVLRDVLSQRHFTELARRAAARGTPAALGAGGVTDTSAAEAALAAGAAFLRGADFNEAVARMCNRHRVAYIPTCSGVSEIHRAEELGVEIICVRADSDAGGPDTVRRLHTQSPASHLLAGDGQALSEARVRQWFEAGVSVLLAGRETLTSAILAGASDGVRARIADVRRWVRRARGGKLFQGVEHVGLYEHRGATAAEITAWYRDTFSWDVEEGKAYYFAAGDGPGRIEVMKVGTTDRCHLAIKVADLEEASAVLKEKGIDLVPPETRPDGRKIFFTVTDPAGNILHLLP
jgi:2-dehydro-3-deoxyphosphogluconate aldolase/(4S)-4-hydroxy-2-oxoglutarate aldolase